jgi:hypothetical protein
MSSIILRWNLIALFDDKMNYFKYCCLSWDCKHIPQEIDNKIPIKFIRHYLNYEFYGNKKIYCYDIDECISLLNLSSERPLYIKNIPSIDKNFFGTVVDWFIEKYGMTKRIKVTDFMY